MGTRRGRPAWVVSPAVRISAAAEFARPVHIVLSGLPAWTVWRTNYLMQLVGGRNRGTLLVEWLLSYFSRRIVADIT